jgi:hypothetical protein
MSMAHVKVKKDKYAIGIAKINTKNPILNFKKYNQINQ